MTEKIDDQCLALCKYVVEVKKAGINDHSYMIYTNIVRRGINSFTKSDMEHIKHIQEDVAHTVKLIEENATKEMKEYIKTEYEKYLKTLKS